LSNYDQKGEMAGASAEITSLWQASGSPFNVRSPGRQSGVRVGLAGHVRLGMESPKNCSTSIRHLLTPILFHPLGWRESQCALM
ncbi:hypothetical protein, partial [Acidithiobacillus sp.]|uniref:hypothetical protein n=1 Tax=Acidithiobacillus sp. TaxID=1872118 RepID=UPI003D0683D2